MENIGIVIPSYNEEENIVILLEKIFEQLPRVRIVIVDDSNPQANKRLKDAVRTFFSKKKQQITLLSRAKKSGRGSAVLTGLSQLLKDTTIQYFFEMDADLAHDPKDFNKFLTTIISHHADVVIGSRYLQKSKIVKWPMRRLVLSKIINRCINTWLGLQMSDYTNGFRLYNRNTVSYLLTLKLREKGFIALSEIAYRLKNNKCTIVEVPITFTDRKYGKSSADIHEFLSSLLGIFRIKILPVQYSQKPLD